MGNVCSEVRGCTAHGVLESCGLLSAEFALFTAGPDRKSYDEIRRFDGDNEYNKDNIVKVGP